MGVAVRRSYRELAESPELRAIALGQFGFIQREQLVEAGFTEALFTRAKKEGLIEQSMPGVFRFVWVSGAFEGALKQGLLSLPKSAVVSHAAAAMLHGLDGVVSAQPEFLAPNGLAPRKGIRLHRSRRRLFADEIGEVKGFPVTSVKRTLLDLAPGVSYLALVMAMDCALRRKLVTLQELREYLESKRGTRHKRKRNFERALEDCEARGQPFRSALEVRWWVESIDAGLPVPLIEAAVRDYIGWLFPDFLYPTAWVVLETKGHKFHGERWMLEKDARRQLRLACLGFPVITVTWKMMEKDTPRVIRRVRLALESLAAQPRGRPATRAWRCERRAAGRTSAARPADGTAA